MSDVKNYSQTPQSVGFFSLMDARSGRNVMRVIYRWVKRFTFVMHVISGVLLLGMMTSTLFDVITRALFNLTDGALDWTFIGSIEFTRYGLLIAIFFTLPYALGRAQVIVDLFTETLNPRAKNVLEGVYMLGFMLMGAGMSYRFFLSIEEVSMSGETTQDLLIPMTYFYALTSFATAVLALMALLEALKLFIHGRGEIA
jgi:TRAP-type C4-dicarboxylate transport system permease small subunit